MRRWEEVAVLIAVGLCRFAKKTGQRCRKPFTRCGNTRL